MRYRKLTKYKYQLVEQFQIKTEIKPQENICTKYIKLLTNGLLTIEEGYAWDGASGPAIDTENFITPSLVHDAFYQLMRERYLNLEWRKAADRLLKDMCLERGMYVLRANWVYYTVRTFGWIWQSDRQKPTVFEVS